MRIGDFELRNIRGKVLDDLYRKSEDELKKRKTAIAKKSRELYLEPIQHLLDQLPIEMISHSEDYCLKVKYTPTDNKTEIVIDERWEYKAKDPIMNPKTYARGGSYYSNVPESKLDPRLQASAAELCEDILTLRIEKQKMSTYLIETTTRYTGSLQLRKVWPDNLHKYLPAEPIKISRQKHAKKISTPDPVVPETLKTRLTTNLLEGE
jgi:hypothetical protein